MDIGVYMDIFELAKKANDKDFEQLILSESISLDNIDLLDDKHHTPLFYAIEMGNTKMALHLIEKGATLQTDKYTSFQVACFFGQLEMAKLLYKEQFENIPDFYGNSPLIEAAWNGHTQVVEWLLSLGADVNAVNLHGDSPLLIALRFKQLETTKLLLSQKDIETNKHNGMGYNPLVIAIVNGYLDIADSLYHKTDDLNKSYTENNTLLHMCAMIGNIASVQWLLDKGANLQVKNSSGMRPLDLAALRGHRDLSALIMTNMVKNKEFFKDLAMVLILAAGQGHAEILDLVLNYRKKFPTACVHAALMFAVTHNHLNIVPRLLAIQSGKAIKLINTHYNYGHYEFQHGGTLLHAAADKGLLSMVQSLVSQGAHLELTNHNKDTVLHSAVLSGNIDLVRWLCNQNFFVNHQNKQGNTPLHFAIQMKNVAMIRCLLLHGADYLITNHQNQSPEVLARGQNDLHNVFKEFKEEHYDDFGLTELHEAAASKEDKSLLQILPVFHNLKAQSVDGLTPIQLAAHLGNINPLSILLLWQANCTLQGAKLLALEFRKQYNPKSTAYKSFTQANIALQRMPAERLESLIWMFNFCEQNTKNKTSSSKTSSDEKKEESSLLLSSSLRLFKPATNSQKIETLSKNSDATSHSGQVLSPV